MKQFESVINKENLSVVAEALIEIAPRAFDMSVYSHLKPLTSAVIPLSEHSCGTAGCVVGHMPYISRITGKIPAPGETERFRAYGTRVAFKNYDDDECPHFDFRLWLFELMFGYGWKYIDNSVEGAVKRIKFVIDNEEYLFRMFSQDDEQSAKFLNSKEYYQ
jgi:hypothetical protein